jgi:hypothetical protein
MTQTSFFDFDFPFGVLFPTRSSPLICAFDILHVLVLLPLYICLGASVPGAARCVVRDAAWQRPQRIGNVTAGAEAAVVVVVDGDNNRDERVALTLAEQHPRAHTILFVLGVLPQAVKLFSMRGIPLTQVCGGLYLSSFLVVAGVGALARRAEYETIPQPWTTLKKKMIVPRPGLLILMLVLMPHAYFWVWCAQGALPAWDTKSTAYFIICMFSLPGFIVLMLLFFSLLLDLSYIFSSLPFFFLPDTRHFANLESTAFIFLLASSFMTSGYFYLTNSEFIFVTFQLAFPFYVVFVLVLVAPTYLLVILFALINFGSSILYYRFRYDPTGTVKPLWTEKLG